MRGRAQHALGSADKTRHNPRVRFTMRDMKLYIHRFCSVLISIALIGLLNQTTVSAVALAILVGLACWYLLVLGQTVERNTIAVKETIHKLYLTIRKQFLAFWKSVGYHEYTTISKQMINSCEVCELGNEFGVYHTYNEVVLIAGYEIAVNERCTVVLCENCYKLCEKSESDSAMSVLR